VSSTPFNPVDAAWLAMEDPTNLMMVTGVLMLDGALDDARFRRLLEERLLTFDRFRRRVEMPPFGLGLPTWVEDATFDLDNHVHRVALPEPGDQAALEALVSDLLGTPLDLTKSPWQLHLVEHDGGTVVIARLHHCIADGIALIQVLLSLTDTSARPRRAAGGGDSRRPATDPWQRAGRWLAGMGGELLRDPSRALAGAGMGLGAAGTLAQLALLPSDPITALKGPLGAGKRVAWSAPIDLDTIKQTGRRHHATVNDVLLTAAAGALRGYLAERGESTSGLELRATVPVNLRGGEAGARGLGNRFGLVFLPLPLGIEDGARRLHELHLRASQLKSSLQPLVAYGALYGIGLLPGPARQRAVDFFGSKASLVVSNVPGPTRRLYLAGRPLRQVVFWVPQAGRLGLGMSILSYAGSVTIGVAGDGGLVPDPERLVAGFEDEVAQLVEATPLRIAGGATTA
jgi:diacylglycerol O-acyltransferase / wax synthase